MSTSTEKKNRNKAGVTAWGKKLFILAALLVFAMCLPLAGHQTHSSKMAEELVRAEHGSMVDVIIQYKHMPTEAHHQNVRNKGGELKRELHVI